MIRVAIGRVDGNRIEAVGLVPDEPEIVEDALAALRTLEVVAKDVGPDVA